MRYYTVYVKVISYWKRYFKQNAVTPKNERVTVTLGSNPALNTMTSRTRHRPAPASGLARKQRIPTVIG